MKYNKKVEVANQKYYNYLVDKITEGTMIMTHSHIERSDPEYWIMFLFDDKDNHTSYRAGIGKCNIFNLINATRRITDFLIKDGLKSKEIPEVIKLLKLRWEMEYNLKFTENSYGLPVEYIPDEWEN